MGLRRLSNVKKGYKKVSCRNHVLENLCAWPGTHGYGYTLVDRSSIMCDRLTVAPMALLPSSDHPVSNTETYLNDDTDTVRGFANGRFYWHFVTFVMHKL